jgi:hypothetical protein
VPVIIGMLMKVSRKVPRDERTLGLEGLRLRALPFFCIVLTVSFVIFQQPVWAKDVTLAWDTNMESNLAGYKIYYIPGASGGQVLANYTGTGAAEGSSPIVAGLSTAFRSEWPGTKWTRRF